MKDLKKFIKTLTDEEERKSFILGANVLCAFVYNIGLEKDNGGISVQDIIYTLNMFDIKDKELCVGRFKDNDSDKQRIANVVFDMHLNGLLDIVMDGVPKVSITTKGCVMGALLFAQIKPYKDEVVQYIVKELRAKLKEETAFMNN
jgi:hypothetical protein